MKNPEFAKSLEAETTTTTKEIKPQAKLAILIFGIAIVMVLVGGAFPNLVTNMSESTENFAVALMVLKRWLPSLKLLHCQKQH